jgi:hypothetical protein
MRVRRAHTPVKTLIFAAILAATAAAPHAHAASTTLTVQVQIRPLFTTIVFTPLKQSTVPCNAAPARELAVHAVYSSVKLRIAVFCLCHFLYICGGDSTVSGSTLNDVLAVGV